VANFSLPGDQSVLGTKLAEILTIHSIDLVLDEAAEVTAVMRT
jgi:hypothetical protein